MNIKKFADLHNQNHRTVSIYIQRHPELFQGHIEEFENQKILDDEAIRLLELQYPLPKPVQIIENTETQQKYINALEQINYLQNQILHVREQLDKLKSMNHLLECKNIENESKIDIINKELVDTKVENKQKEKDFEILKKKYDELKNRNLWDRIFNKD